MFADISGCRMFDCSAADDDGLLSLKAADIEFFPSSTFAWILDRKRLILKLTDRRTRLGDCALSLCHQSGLFAQESSNRIISTRMPSRRSWWATSKASVPPKECPASRQGPGRR